MTTISYNHKDKEIAVDSRLTECDLIITDNDDKFIKKEGITFFLCGGYSASYLLVDVYLGTETDKENLDANIILIEDGKLFCVSYLDGSINKWSIEHDTAWGSGEKFALAAMDFGCSAEEAVKYAMTRDIYTGGEVKVIEVK